jgi:hypothetical protein
MYHSFQNKYSFNILSLAFITSFIFILTTPVFSQLAPVTPPTGGFRIDGNLIAGTPTTGEGDWVAGSSGGYVFYNTGVAVNPTHSKLTRDSYHSTGDDVFSGSSFAQNPNAWKWANASAANKTDISNGMYHIASDGMQKWVIMGGDREANTGTSYIDFEFYQGYLTKNNNNSFSSLSADSTSLVATGGRTVGDFVLSMEYTNGGAIATVHYYRWELSGGTYRYVEYSIPTGTSGPNAFGASNTTTISTPLGAFGLSNYAPYLFVEAAVNVDAILSAINPCSQISIKTVFIKTKASDSYNAALKDFIAPIPVNFVFGHESFSYPEGPFYNCGTLTPTFTGTGTFSASPTGLSLNSTTGVIDLSASTPGTYTITYTYNAGGGCTMPAEATVTILPLPAPAKVSNQILCSGSPSSAISFSSALTPVSFSWVNDQTSIGLAASGTGNISSFTAINNSTSSVTATITYTPNYTTNGASCAGPSDYFTIRVNPLPEAAQVRIDEPSICGPSTGTITVTSPVGSGYLYKNNGGEWQTDSVFAGIAAGSGYHILVKDGNGCISGDDAECATATTSNREVNKTEKQQPATVRKEVSTFTVKESKNISIKVYPNPFQSRVQFEVNVDEAGYGSLEIYNMMGQKIKTIYAGQLNKGLQYFSTIVPAGTHQLVYILRTGEQKVSGTVIRE